MVLGKERNAQVPDAMQGARLGPGYGDGEIEACLAQCGAVYQRLSPDELVERTAELLARHQVVGWFQGRMEFGPRALGGRSILADPRSPDMQRVLNLKVKFRESFRPFAPAVLAEDAREYFDLDTSSPYMLLVAQVSEEIRRTPTPEERARQGLDMLNVPRSSIPAVTHVDYSARVQTVAPGDGPFYGLLQAFKRKAGCSVLVNTSMNVRGEPIVCRPEEAYRCLMKTAIDAVVIGPFLLERRAQTVAYQPQVAAALARTD
jgi:carbamoyltransferase